MPDITLQPLTVTPALADPWALVLGGKIGKLSFDWRPFHERLYDHRQDYRRLFWDLRETGAMKNPLIVFGNRVLIGMRRLEIARFLDWPSVPVVRINEDIRNDPGPERIFELRDRIYVPVRY